VEAEGIALGVELPDEEANERQEKDPDGDDELGIGGQGGCVGEIEVI